MACCAALLHLWHRTKHFNKFGNEAGSPFDARSSRSKRKDPTVIPYFSHTVLRNGELVVPRAKVSLDGFLDRFINRVRAVHQVPDLAVAGFVQHDRKNGLCHGLS